MNLYKSKLIARLVTIIAWLIILSVVLLLIFFIGYFNDISVMYPFGTANDVTNSIVALLTAVLATILMPAPRKKPLWFALLLLLAAAAWVGTAIVTIDSLDAGGIISNLTRQKLRIHYNLGFIARENLHFGLGLQGLWLIGLNLFALLENIWSRKVIVIGLAAGLVMVVGLMDAAQINILGVSILYPIWCFWLARWIKAQDKDTAERERVTAST